MTIICLSLFIGNSFCYSAEKDAIYKNIDKCVEKSYEVYNSTWATPLLKHNIKNRIKYLEWKKGHIKSKSVKKSSNSKLNTNDIKLGNTNSNNPFKLGKSYCFPNPSKSVSPTIHIETGLADKVEVFIYDISGKKVEEFSINSEPLLIDDGKGSEYAYEKEFDISKLGSGVYLIYFKSYKANETLKGRFKCAIIK